MQKVRWEIVLYLPAEIRESFFDDITFELRPENEAPAILGEEHSR
jgi:hypothetical protein